MLMQCWQETLSRTALWEWGLADYAEGGRSLVCPTGIPREGQSAEKGSKERHHALRKPLTYLGLIKPTRCWGR